MFGEKEARTLIQQVLKRCGPVPAEVLFFVEDNALTRFAGNTIHQNVAERNTDMIVRCMHGNKIGAATTNRMDESALDEVTGRALANAKASPEDPNYPGLPEPAQFQTVQAYDDETAVYSPEARGLAVARVCQIAREQGLNASGAFSTGSGEIVIANSNGLFAYFPSTQADFQTVVMGEDASGYAHGSDWRAGSISIEELGRDAIAKAGSGANPQKIDPGEYTVILDPYATEDIVNSLNMYGMGAQAVLDGRSWMTDRIGKKVMSDLVSIWDDGMDLKGTPMPFDFEGVPKQRVDLVCNGVPMGPVYDRYTGKKAGKESTGHAMPPTFRGMGPVAINLFMAPGGASLDDMIRSTKKGLYITRFWYTRLVHPSDCVVTGMTRDGVYMIENGQIVYPVKNLRFTQSYVNALEEVEAVGKETRLQGSEFGGMSVRVPALKINRFNFTGTTV